MIAAGDAVQGILRCTVDLNLFEYRVSQTARRLRLSPRREVILAPAVVGVDPCPIFCLVGGDMGERHMGTVGSGGRIDYHRIIVVFGPITGRWD